MIVANILDPIHDNLDPTVWEDVHSGTPKLKERHRKWIVNTIKHVLIEHGYDQVDSWLTLVLTGSLTTYQYSEHSDVDVSLFVNVEHFPEWSRAEMIGVMVENVDGKKLPGTTHPMQCFVVPPGVTKDMLYKPGLRSGYDLYTSAWVVPPERGRVHDVQTEMNSAYVYALECADKMDRLLHHEPDKAVYYWHMLHRARQRDQRSGKGDFALTNIVYKFLDKKGLLPEIAHASGEYIAKVAMPIVPNWLDQSENGFGINTVGYHTAPAQFHQAIMNMGLLPWDDPSNSSGTRYPGGHIQPRPGHVYLSTTHPGKWGYGTNYGPEGHVVYHVDMSKLHPQNINPDEDHMALPYGDAGDLRQGENPETGKWEDEDYGAYAERAGWGDNPLETLQHVRDGQTLAHRGPIPPEAIVGYTHYMPGPELMPGDVDAMTPNPRYLAKTASGIHDLVHKLTLENGGATINPAGVQPTEGYAFAPHKHTEETVPVNQFTPGHVADYMTRHNNEFMAPEAHMGTWVDDGKVYLDVSHVIPNYNEAYQRAHAADQLAMFDLSTFNEIPVHKTADTAEILQNFAIDEDALKQACASIGLQYPVDITIVGGTHGQYMGFDGNAHQINIVGWLRPESANKEIWEELVHALQYERDPAGWSAEMNNYWEIYNQGHDAYMDHPWEQEAHAIADNPPFSIVTAPGVTSNKGNSYGNIQEEGKWALAKAFGK